MFYLTTHSTHIIYGYMASDIWLRTILIVRKETRRQDNTYHGLCYTSRGTLAGTRSVFRRKEGNVLFNDALNTFYLRLYGVIHMVKNHLDSERGNPLPPHGLLFPISSKGSFVCVCVHTHTHTHI